MQGRKRNVCHCFENELRGSEGKDAVKRTRQETAGSTVQCAGGWAREEATEWRGMKREDMDGGRINGTWRGRSQKWP